MNAINSNEIMAGIDHTSAITHAFMLAEMSFSVWTGRKKNKDVSDEVISAKGARSKNAATVYNALLGDAPELAAISNFVSSARKEHSRYTQPWSDTGARTLALDFLDEYLEFEQRTTSQFWELVQKFLDSYDALVVAASFELGNMFKRENYPTKEELAEKFNVNFVIAPMPTSGDFRLAVAEQQNRELALRYERAMRERVDSVQNSLLSDVFAHLERMVERLAVDENGKKAVFKNTLVSEAQFLVTKLKAYNVANDPNVAELARRMEEVLKGKDPDVLREQLEVRESTRNKVQEILDAFEF